MEELNGWVKLFSDGGAIVLLAFVLYFAAKWIPKAWNQYQATVAEKDKSMQEFMQGLVSTAAQLQETSRKEWQGIVEQQATLQAEVTSTLTSIQQAIEQHVQEAVWSHREIIQVLYSRDMKG